MSLDNSKDTLGKKMPAENKIAKAKPESGAATETKSESPTTKTEGKSDIAPKKQGMGEGQKPVSKAYKDNWNAIFAKKKR